MKTLKRILLILLLIIVLALFVVWFYLYSTKPKYSGALKISALQEKVDVYFDEWGIPHIYAQNETDAYKAFGYLHAQERLFQMEMMKRVASGRLAEILGKDLVETDKFFLTLGLEDAANRSIKANHKGDELFAKAAQAYLDGVNEFIRSGKTPIEFTILGIPKEEFKTQDFYLIAGYMAFTFSSGFTVDPIVSKINKKLGSNYLKDWGTIYQPGTEQIPSNKKADIAIENKLISYSSKIISSIPIPTWIGSNSWVVAPSKTKSGKVIFSNDTHIGYGQPSVFFEAHMEYPGQRIYGNYIAGVPFALLGHNQNCAWGLTMFENDDLDMFREKLNPENPNQVWFQNRWENLTIRDIKIKVKGATDIDFQVKSSRHGPIMDGLQGNLDPNESAIAVSWTFPMIESRVIEAFYMLNNSINIKNAEAAASLIYSPGLNVMYGDVEGNIAWWAAAKLVKRAAHVNSKIILDGASGKDEYLGYYDFSENPRLINPASGFVYSANNQPDTMAGILYPGYYAPEFRAKRIVKLLSTDKKWSVEEMKRMITDDTSAVHPEMAKLILSLLSKDDLIKKGGNYSKAFQLLSDWKGGHAADAVEPTIFYKLLYQVLFKTFADEMGEKDFNAISSSHLMGNTYPFIFKDKQSVWWDDISTNEKETRADVFNSAFNQSIVDLEKQLGSDMSKWNWSRVHTLEHHHPLGTVKPLDKLFNVGPFGVKGGNQVINNIDFQFSRDGIYKATYGPAIRILLDFADIENSISVLPTGESGNFMSKHYSDQAEIYNLGQFRKQVMNKDEIIKTNTGILALSPK
jgi:penicillin amidase